MLFVTAGSVLDIHAIWFVLAIVGVIVLLLLPRLVRAIPRVHGLIDDEIFMITLASSGRVATGQRAMA